MVQIKRGFSGNVVLRQYESLVDPRVLVTSIEQAEVATLEGDRFSSSFDVVIPSGETVYLYGSVPAESGISVGFQNRILKSESGPISFNVRWDATVSALGDPVIAFNENTFYRGVKDAQIEINEVDPLDVTDLGIVRESDFISGSGVGSNTSGDVSSDNGFRVYAPGDNFLIEIINTHSGDNRVLLGYSWVEAPVSFLGD